MKKRKDVLGVLIIIFILLNILGVNWVVRLFAQNRDDIESLVLNSKWEKPSHPYRIEKATGMVEKWEKNEIFSLHKLFDSGLVAGESKIIFLGALSDSDPQGLIVLDAFDGSVLWKSDPIEVGSDFAVDEEFLYVGLNSSGEIQKISLGDYTQVWSNTLKPLHGPCCMHIVGDQLQVNWEPNRFLVLSKEEGNLNGVFSKEGSPMLHVDKDVKYYRGGTTALCADSIDGVTLWNVQLDEEYWQVPIFDEKMIFVRSGMRMGKVYAIERITGEVIWVSSKNVISTIAQSDKRLFFFTDGGSLLGVGKESGQVELSVEFSHDNLTNPSIRSMSNYEVAYDPSNQTIYLLLGDSAQLFSFQETLTSE